MKHKTIDGQPILMSVSGFEQYTTSESVNPATKPTHVMDAAELLSLLVDVRKSLQNSELEHLQQTVAHHLTVDNPHDTNLSDFTEQVVHIFYNHYVALGGTLSLEEYSISLFNMLRIATPEEMRDESPDPLLLVSIGGAKEYINGHDADPNAHQALFEKLMPGSPITYDPAFALQASVGVSSEWFEYNKTTVVDPDAEEITEVEQPYSFINPGGYLEYAPLGMIPIDHVNGKASIPCFDYRKNTLLDSEGLSTLLPDAVNKIESAVMNPKKENKSISIFTGNDLFAIEHSVILPALTLEYRQPQTFSVFAKAGTCRYLSISYVDIAESGMITRGIYDLFTGQCVTINPLERYRASSNVIGNGWVRCEFSLLHEIGQISDLKITFFKEAESESLENTTFVFRGDNEECGQLWGIQLEDGFEASPYIPTTDKPAYREPISINIALDEEFTKSYFNTMSIEMITPKITHYSNLGKPIAVLNDVENRTLASCYKQFDNQIKFTIYDFEDSPSIRFYPILGNKDTTTMTVSMSEDKIFYQLNEIGSDAPASDYDAMGGLSLGHDGTGNYLNGYIRSVILYDKGLTYPEILFLHGDLQYES